MADLVAIAETVAASAEESPVAAKLLSESSALMLKLDGKLIRGMPEIASLDEVEVAPTRFSTAFNRAVHFSEKVFKSRGFKAFQGAEWTREGDQYQLLAGRFELTGATRAEAFGKVEAQVGEHAKLIGNDQVHITTSGHADVVARGHSQVFVEGRLAVNVDRTGSPYFGKVTLEDRSRFYDHGSLHGGVLEDKRVFSAPPNTVLIPTTTPDAPSIVSPVAHDLQSPVANAYETFRDKVVQIVMHNPENPAKIIGRGSGFFIGRDGQIATAEHVVRSGGPVEIITADGSRFDAAIESKDEERDLATLRVNRSGNQSFPVVSLAASSKVPVGTPTMVLGYPSTTGLLHAYPGRLLGNSETLGNSGIMQMLGMEPRRVLMTDSFVHPGSSGGPLINLNTGEVLGVNTEVLGNLLGPGRGEGASRIEELSALLKDGPSKPNPLRQQINDYLASGDILKYKPVPNPIKEKTLSEVLEEVWKDYETE